MRKIILFAIAFCVVFLTSCNCGRKNHIIISDEDNEWTTYLNQFYEEINTEGRKYVAVDLRSKELYETEHLRQFQNYDLNSGSIDELNTWLCSNYSNKYIIYIYIESLENLKTFNILFCIIFSFILIISIFNNNFLLNDNYKWYILLR